MVVAIAPAILASCAWADWLQPRIKRAVAMIDIANVRQKSMAYVEVWQLQVMAVRPMKG
jgi:hypothetical protein